MFTSAWLGIEFLHSVSLVSRAALGRSESEHEIAHGGRVYKITALALKGAKDGVVLFPGQDITELKQLRRAKRIQEQSAPLMVDANDFRLYNDEHGHILGDKCLQDLAAALEDAAKRRRWRGPIRPLRRGSGRGSRLLAVCLAKAA